MQFFTVIVALAAAAASAAPSPSDDCNPGARVCLNSRSGWKTCTASRTWTLGGACGAYARCFPGPDGTPQCRSID